MTPNAIKESKVYSIIPSSGNGDFTFTRGTLASSTLNNDAGLIETVPYNLLDYSEQFNNTSIWTKYGTANVIADTTNSPNGSLTADTLSGATGTISWASGNVLLRTLIVSPSTTYTFSIYVKSLGATTFSVGLRDNSTTGVIVTTAYTIDSTWQRLTATYTTGSAQTVLGIILGNTNGSVAVWGSQVVQGSLPKDYFFTTDRLNVPRLNYDTVGGCPSLLLEPQRTNLVAYSEQFDNVSGWISFNATVNANSTTSPSGTLTADSFIPNTTLGDHRVNSFSFTSVLNSYYSISVYAKSNGYNFLRLSFGGGGGGGYTFFNLSNGTLGITNSMFSNSITNVGNGWYRCTVTRQSTIAATLSMDLYCTSADNQFSWSGNGTSGIYVWGAQLEEGAYATSIIPTVASTVTRNLDDCYITGVSTDILNASEGTFYVEAASIVNDLTQKYIEITDGSDNNRVTMDFGVIINNLRLQTTGGGAIYRVDVSVSNITSYNKVLIKWGSLGKFAYVNGIKYTLNLVVGSGTGIPTALNRITFRQWWGATPFYGKCKGMQIYKTALSDAECAALTT